LVGSGGTPQGQGGKQRHGVKEKLEEGTRMLGEREREGPVYKEKKKKKTQGGGVGGGGCGIGGGWG